MQQSSYEYTVSVNDAGFAVDVTGSNWVLTTNTVPDGLGHRVVIINNSATDFSSLTASLSGTDADGNPQTETMSLPGPMFVSFSSKFYSTLTSVVPESTIGTDTMNIGWSGAAVTQTIPVDWRSNAFTIINVILGEGLSSLYSFEQTNANVYDAYPSTLPWFPIPGLSDRNQNSNGISTPGANALRLNLLDGSDEAVITFTLHPPGPPTF